VTFRRLKAETFVEVQVRTEQPLDYVGYQEADSASQIIQVESSRLVPMLVVLAGLSLLVSGVSLGVGWWSTESYSRDYKELERENRLLQLKVDDMRVALNSQGISTNKHAASESP
jgi:hypothetical protein